MTYILHRNLKAELSTVVGGDDAVKAQTDKLAFAHASFFTSTPAEDLAEFLIKRAPEGVGNGWVMIRGSGSEAMEAALKLARQYHLERGEPSRTRIIACAPSYHGNTLGALATGGHAGRRAPFQPILIDVDHIDAAYAYRMQKAGETEDDFARRMADLLEDRIQALGPETVIAFFAEPVVGASLGSQPAPKGYYKSIREICDAHGVLYIADEVMCGMGRPGWLFALEQEGIHADITKMAKGLGAGYQPFAAVMASEAVITEIEAGSGQLWNGHTYMSHAVAAAGALAVQKLIERENLLENVRARGAQLAAGLKGRLAQHPNVGDIRGRGLFWTVELVSDRETKTPFPAVQKLAPKIQKAALDLGLMCYPAQGCADGTNKDHVLPAPSCTSTSEENDQVIDFIVTAIKTSLEGMSA